ncbi:LOB domain-containing protein 29 [Ricinus communis]|uniref:LOB domain-containing protein, putative n=1 Tax=Ricinus communis TaxID=3988 RepID=B9T847_RICCO|nr:LOB domain-containing protein 29 [Ricinus communis]XP_048233071.1 LOB domain-containing protein 29 [Ricinus communis]EEF27968.1 LOB domain-containing protein, putative [Ricinus communis]|eukprot:XP_025015760.1 LOB domain-containing protein 29 [Ricinus communis]
MTGSGSPCGACKFLRRKCVRGCVFAPYFCHEQGATHFAAIHKVFGASNVSKLLAHLPVSDRCEAAVTISYEAQARLQDPIYGCVSHIFALQQQVMNLQAQLASLKEQAAQTLINGSATANPNDKYYGKPSSLPQDLQSWFQSENSNTIPQFNPSFTTAGENGFLDPYSMGSYGSSSTTATSFDSFEEASSSFDMQTDNKQWNTSYHHHQDPDDLRSVAFGYIQHS